MEQDPALNGLRRCPLFRGQKDFLIKIAPLMVREEIPAGTYLFQEENVGDSMYVVGTGMIAVQKRLDGQAHPLLLLKPGEYFGEMCALVPGRRLMSAKTLETSVLLKLSKKKLDSLRESDPEVVLAFYEKIINFFVLRFRYAHPLVNQIMEEALQRGAFELGQ